MAMNTNRGMTNPIVSRVTNFDDAFTMSDDRASYGGIMAKTLYFLATILLGLGAFLYIHNYYAVEHFTAVEITEGYVIFQNEMGIVGGVLIATFICALIAAFVPATIPFTGTVYCAGMGYAVTFISYTYAAVYKGIIIEALALTILIIAVMSALFASGKVRIGQRFRTVVYTTLLVSVLGGLAFMLLLWIAPESALVHSIIALQSSPIGIVFAVIGVLLGAFFIYFDLESIAETVHNGLSKKYEWYCSYSLMTSVIYLYLKVLQLIARIQDNRS